MACSLVHFMWAHVPLKLTRVTCELVSTVKVCVDGVQPGTFHVSARTTEAVPCAMARCHWITRSRRFEGLYFLQLQGSACPKEHSPRTYRPSQMKELQFFVRSGTAHLGAQCRIPYHTALKTSEPAIRSTRQVRGSKFETSVKTHKVTSCRNVA